MTSARRSNNIVAFPSRPPASGDAPRGWQPVSYRWLAGHAFVLVAWALVHEDAAAGLAATSSAWLSLPLSLYKDPDERRWAAYGRWLMWFRRGDAAE